MGNHFLFCPTFQNKTGVNKPFSSRRILRQAWSRVIANPVAAAASAGDVASAERRPRRVVVTGQGVVTSLGQTIETFYSNLLQGVSGISQIEGFDTSAHGIGA